jgi:CO/xanthine dehydrogenase Mo-binding subunit
VEYEVLEPVTDATEAAKSPIQIHEGGNLLKETVIRRGEPVDRVFARSAHVAEGIFETPFVEHAFLETEASIGLPDGRDGVTVYSQGQGILTGTDSLDRSSRASGMIPVSAGGGFGGKA